MKPDDLTEYYAALLDGRYDCVDRIVLNAYFPLVQSPGGFRNWWRQLTGGDGTLDNTHLMRFSGRFSRRVRAYAEQMGIPLIDCRRGERKHEIAEEYKPADPKFKGLFCILVGKAPAPVYEVRTFSNGAIDLRKKNPWPYVNQYSFHFMDPEWGHVTIKLCPHPPFSAQIILNGHEYVARQAAKKGIPFTKEGNCFTKVSNAAGLARVADTMTAKSCEGRLVSVCERWIYSSCLCFALGLEEQKQTGFAYAYSIYQVEYSRNLLFYRGWTMQQVFDGIIDRTRAKLDLQTLKTIFGRKRRPFYRDRHGKLPKFEVVLERPVYDLTVFKAHFGKLTVKMYSKGEHVLRIEAIAHNTHDLRCGRGVAKFPTLITALREIVERFLAVVRRVDVSFIDDGTLEAWPTPAQIGKSRIGGVDVNRPRIRAVMKALVALAKQPRGFTMSELAAKVREVLKVPEEGYKPSQASYDLRKFRAKDLVRRKKKSHRYESPLAALGAMNAFLVLREAVLKPLLANGGKRIRGPKPPNQSAIDIQYEKIQVEMQKLFGLLGIAA
ncbi:MAG: hypothetical protein HY717_04485 [Planctomycetes bacterium]|nr:hypothetical protein [Planctomycetota bacterium]